jgi:nucleotide-binding universal stress UspA family protein
VLAAASVIASQFKVRLTPVVVTGRGTGRAIVEEAARRHSEVIILGAVHKRRIADRVFGTTVDYVLKNAPCEVLVNLVPRDYPTDGSGEDDALRPA